MLAALLHHSATISPAAAMFHVVCLWLHDFHPPIRIPAVLLNECLPARATLAVSGCALEDG